MRQAILPALLLTAACGSPSETAEEAPTASADECGLPAGEARLVALPGGSFEKGRDPIYPEEGTPMRLQVEGFAIEDHEVTNDEFAAFVAATHHVTSAERNGDSAVFVRAEQSWKLVRGASWRAPEGPGSGLAGRGRHPVVHVSLADAQAYARWAGGRLPSEAEWEYAAAIGLADPANPYSGALDASGRPIANVWQGAFPYRNGADDGFAGTAPVGCFPASEAGLYDMIGNVWEWTDTPFGPGTHTIKGGSHLCAENFCRRYRPAARQPQEDDFSASHIGFRIVRDSAD